MRNFINHTNISNLQIFDKLLKSKIAREEITQNPRLFLARYGIMIPIELDIVVIGDQPQVHHFVMPALNERELGFETQYIYAAHGSLSTVGTVTTVATFSTNVSCASTATSGMCISTLGCMHHD